MFLVGIAALALGCQGTGSAPFLTPVPPPGILPAWIQVGQVRHVQFTTGDLIDRILVLQYLERYQSGGMTSWSHHPNEYLLDMVHTEVLRQASPELGLSVTEAEIDEELCRRLCPVAPEARESDPGRFDQEYAKALAGLLTATNLTESEFRVLVEGDLLRPELFRAINSALPERTEQVETAWIRLETNGPVDPQEVRKRLETENFGLVASEFHWPAGFTNQQGYAGWVPEGALPYLDEVLFGNPDRKPLPVGEISAPVFTHE